MSKTYNLNYDDMDKKKTFNIYLEILNDVKKKKINPIMMKD